MNKARFFLTVRRFVEANAVEPKPGFRNNNLSIEVDGFSLAIEGRNRGEGYVTVSTTLPFELVADELIIHHIHFNEIACASALMAIIEAQAAQIERMTQPDKKKRAA